MKFSFLISTPYFLSRQNLQFNAGLFFLQPLISEESKRNSDVRQVHVYWYLC